MGVMDAYCERVGPGLFAEPLNAVTNLSFIFAAWAAWILAKRTNTLTTEIKVLIAIAVSVGIGSILWHTLPNSWTLILDIGPIVIFIMYYIWLYTRSVMGKSILFASLSVVAFLVALSFAFPYSNILHGAPVYTPGLLVVLILGIYHGLKQKTARFLLLSTAGVYFTALFFRTIDQEICHFIPIGTHFIWHSLIGLVTYMAMRALILNLTPKAVHEEKTAKRMASV
jgi:Ceramidase